MAAMYLLDHPDHYTSHKFQRFYWHSFIKYIDKSWQAAGSDFANEKLKDNVALFKNKTGTEIFGVSRVDDYIHRPVECKDMSLYDWIRFAHKEKIPQSVIKALRKRNEQIVSQINNHRWVNNLRVQFSVHWADGDTTWETYTTCAHLQALDDYFARYNVTHWRSLPKLTNHIAPPLNGHMFDNTDTSCESDTDGESEIDYTEFTDQNNNADETDDSDVESIANTDSECDNYNDNHDLSTKPTSETNITTHKLPKAGTYFFDEDHPQLTTHWIRIKHHSKGLIPDFKPITIPRRDKGNYEDYCMSMLIFFKPWRTLDDLKVDAVTWSDTFDNHSFTPRQRELMENFHLRYECLDARDDFSAKRKAGILQNTDLPFANSEQALDDLDEDAFNDNGEALDIAMERAAAQAEEYRQTSRSSQTMMKRMREAERMMHITGALDQSDAVLTNGVTQEETGDAHSSNEWKAMLIEHKKKLLIERKLLKNLMKVMAQILSMMLSMSLK